MATTSQRMGRSCQTYPACVTAIRPRQPSHSDTRAHHTAQDASAQNASDVAIDFARRVLDVVDTIPSGRVMAYGDIAEYLGGGGPRRVANVMSTRGAEVPWWRVLRADGTPAPQVAARQLRHLHDEGTPMKPSGDRVDIAHARWFGPGS